MVGLQGSQKTTEPQNGWVGRVLEDQRTMESYDGWVEGVLDDQRTIESQSGWVGKVLKDHTTTARLGQESCGRPQSHGVVEQSDCTAVLSSPRSPLPSGLNAPKPLHCSAARPGPATTAPDWDGPLRAPLPPPNAARGQSAFGP